MSAQLKSKSGTGIVQKPVRELAPTPEAPPTLLRRRGIVLLLCGMSFVLSLPLFAPASAWPLAYVVLVPWMIAVCGSSRRGWAIFCSYLLGAAFFLTHWRWLYSTTPPGYIAGSLWFGLYFPLAALGVRHLRQRRGVNLAIALPVVWTLTELMRSRGPLAFPWFLLGHSQINLLPICQIADITGVYGVSFVVAAVNGWIADLLLARLSVRAGQPAPALRLRLASTALVCSALLAGTTVYGIVRMRETGLHEGPKVSVVQGDFVLSPIDTPGAPTDADKRATYMELLEKAAAARPDMIVLPETPWALYLNRELRELPSNIHVVEMSRQQNLAFQHLARRHKAHVVIGSMSLEPQPRGVYPDTHRYNSAFVYPPSALEPGRYDKIHLVLFGEYVPFRYSGTLHWLYKWLNSITPWGADGFEYSLTEGKAFRTFSTADDGSSGAGERFAITICYEDVIPQVFRQFVAGAEGKRVDFMLNISNDGWFGHGTQQPQHLVNCAFRAIENRVGIARAVNTGVSGFIRPDGSWHDLVSRSERRPDSGGTGYRTARVTTDPRLTLYSRYGDVFGALCSLLAIAGILDALLWRWTGRRRIRKEQPG